MKRIIILLFVSAISVYVAWGRSVTRLYEVVNLNGENKPDMPVVISLEGWERSAVVMLGEYEISSQIDDLDRDGISDELAFVVNMEPNGKMLIEVTVSDQEPQNSYEPRVHAQMFLKEDGGLASQTEVSSTEDNMYNKLHHHGPAFESELMAYRLYFDRKQTVDIYGKYYPGLELAETLWYPTDEQLAQDAGDDILRVFGSVGVGTLKGWDAKKEKAIHIEPMERRTARILANGPVRTVVDMDVRGWTYAGAKIDVNSRYTLFAGHRDVLVENTFTGDVADKIFVTGVMKMPREDFRSYLVCGSRTVVPVGQAAPDEIRLRAMSQWGTDFPVNDTVKYARQTVGLAVKVAERYIVRQVEDNVNYLYLLRPDGNNQINYFITVVAQKERFTPDVNTADEFEMYVKNWAPEREQAVYRLVSSHENKEKKKKK